MQQFVGIVAEPLLTAPGPDDLLRVSNDASMLVVGLSDRWVVEGLAPSQTRTRFTWSLAGS